jgi:hypothetical protein
MGSGLRTSRLFRRAEDRHSHQQALPSPARRRRRASRYCGIAQASGVEAVSAPRPPAAMMAALSEACRSVPNHWLKALKEAIKQADTPSPISARAIASSRQRRAPTANRPQPAAAISSSEGFDAARAITVESQAERQLYRAEGQQVGAGQQAQVGGRNAEFARQFRRDDGIDVAQEVGKVIAGGEGQEDSRSQRFKSYLRYAAARPSGRGSCAPSPGASPGAFASSVEHLPARDALRPRKRD